MYSDMIIDFITQQVSPKEICQQLGLCLAHVTNQEQFQMLGHVNDMAFEAEQPDQDEIKVIL
jgi:hypothetical protein